jgi:hypothetical protein
MRTELNSPLVFIPHQSSRLTAFEMPQIEAALPLNLDALDDIKSQVGSPCQSLDVDALFHVHRVLSLHKEQSRQQGILTISLDAITLILITCLSLYFCSYHLTFCCLGNNALTPPRNEPSVEPLTTTEPKHMKATAEIDANQTSVSFTAYSLRQGMEPSTSYG